MDIRDSAVTREILLDCTEEQIEFMNECSLQKMKGMQAYIAIRAGGNTAELSDVPSDKLKAKGVASVKSRVVNLSQLSEAINVDTMAAALRKKFGQVYGLEVTDGRLPSDEILEPIRAEFACPDWNYSRTPEFSHRLAGRFPWGGITLELDVRDGKVADCQVFSDALDSEYILSLPGRLKGCRYDAHAFAAALGKDCHPARDIAALIEQEI